MMENRGFIRHISDKIAIREIQSEDASSLFEILDTNRHQMREWLPFVDSSLYVEDTLFYINMILETDNTQYVLIYEDRIVGMVGFNHIDYINQRVEIGYWMSPDVEGKGIMTQTVKELVKIAFFEKNLNRVQIRVAIGNEKSWKIPERLNFLFEGIERDGELLIEGNFTDIRVYSLLKKEYDKICK